MEMSTLLLAMERVAIVFTGDSARIPKLDKNCSSVRLFRSENVLSTVYFLSFQGRENEAAT
jgi:hypothetical protein